MKQVKILGSVGSSDAMKSLEEKVNEFLKTINNRASIDIQYSTSQEHDMSTSFSCMITYNE
jgi:hypothetical protein